MLAALAAGCNGTTSPAAEIQGAALTTGLRIVGNGDLREPRYTNGGDSNQLTVTGNDLQGFESVFVLNTATLAVGLASQTETFLDPVTGFDITVQADDNSEGGSPSYDGSLAAFVSQATNMLELGQSTQFRRHVYVRDLMTGKNQRIDAGASSGPGRENQVVVPSKGFIPEANGDTSSANLSSDGRFVIFASDATNIVPAASNGLSQIFLFDRQLSYIELISRNDDAYQGDAMSFAPMITSTGQYVVFLSDATNLIDGDTNGSRDIFIYDRSSRSFERLDLAAAGLSDPGPPVISGDGNIVAFSARSGGLLAPRQVFVRNRALGTTTMASMDAEEDPGNGDSSEPSVSPDGLFVAFQSEASNLVPGDSNGVMDVFVYGTGSALLVRASVNVDGVEADGESRSPTLSPDGRFIAFVSRALNLVAPTEGNPTPPSRTLDLYLFANPLY